MPNLLSLRTGAGATLVRFDAAFFDATVAPLLARRGFASTASARFSADLRLSLDDVALDRFLAGRDVVPAGRIEACAHVWRALILVDDGRARLPTRSRDVGGDLPLAAPTPATDAVRAPDGRRVKARPRRRTPRVPSAPSPAAPSPAAPSPPSSASDPAAFALGQLQRLAERVVELVRADADAAVVAVVDGAVMVDGVGRATLRAHPPGADRRDGP